MTFSLYEASIPSYIQITGAVSGLLEKAAAFCQEQNIPEHEMVHAKLAEDMLPFAYQISAVSTHSIGSVEGIRKGVFSPDRSPFPETFSDLKASLEKTSQALSELDPTEINAFIGQDMQFKMGDFTMDFTAEDFILSFSQPNFYFHATTAYNILRMKGLNIGKLDFMGAARTKAQ